MLKLTKKVEYALISLVHITDQKDNRLCSAKEIAEILNIVGVSDYVRVSELKKAAVQKLIDNVDHSQVLDYL